MWTTMTTWTERAARHHIVRRDATTVRGGGGGEEMTWVLGTAARPEAGARYGYAVIQA